MEDAASGPDALAIRTLLSRVAEELGGLARLAREVPVPSGLIDDDAIVAAQKQDLLEQTLDDLAAFLKTSAEGVGGSPVAEIGPALGALRLSALAARLSGTRPQHCASGGDLDLF